MRNVYVVFIIKGILNFHPYSGHCMRIYHNMTSVICQGGGGGGGGEFPSPVTSDENSR